MRAIASFLVRVSLALALALALAAGVGLPSAQAQIPAAKAILAKKGGTLPPPPPAPPPTDNLTFYYGPKTLGGNGGQSPCPDVGCVEPTSAPDTANYYWDNTWKWYVPKSSSAKTYNAVRSTPLSGCEDATLTDGLGRTAVTHLCANETIAGTYTVRWRNGDTVDSKFGTNQLFRAYSTMSYGESIAIRGGTYWNTIFNVGETAYKGSVVFRFNCQTGTCLTPVTSPGAYKTIRPEQGTSVMIGPMSLETSGTNGTKLTGFTFDGEASTCVYSGGSCASMFGGVASSFNWIDNSVIIGNTNDEYGRARPKGIILDEASTQWKITDSQITYVYIGLKMPQSVGSYPADVNGTAPAGGHTVTGNLFANISTDNITTTCSRYTTISNNVFTDQKSAIVVGDASTNPPYYNPFDSSRQAHGDHIQLDGQNGGNNFACIYQFYPGIVITNNVMLRGLGRDSIPWWSSPPFPSPNDYTGAPCKSDAKPCTISAPPGATTLPPNPLAGTGSAQGIFFADFTGAGGGHKFSGSGGVERPYTLVLVAPQITGNVVMTEFQNAINLPIVQDGTVTDNGVVLTRPPAANLYDSSSLWTNGRATIVTYQITGTTTFTRNFTTWPKGITVGSYPAGNPEIAGVAGLTAAFQNPTAYPSPRTLSDYKAGYLPLIGGTLQISPHVYAGPFCPDGSANAGNCPDASANDNAPPRISDGLWKWAA